MSRNRDDKFIIEDVARFRKRHGEVLQEVIRVAREDQAFYGDVQCFIPEDAGQAGKVAATYAVNQLAMNGIGAKLIKVGSVSKLNRFKPFAASAEVGSVRVVQAKWNHEFFYELEAFDGTRKSIHDDIVDATSDAFNKLAQNKELPQFTLEVFTR
jgi:predicted phage terminase large subunit-like protein